MKEIDLANEVKRILASTEQRKLRYASELNWFERWQNLWASDRIRVGVIGVTSSGKSTLINALLGDDLLSVAVRPSSSQLVSCSYAKERSAVVYFLNGEKKRVGDTVRLKETIVQYSDENYNKRNQKQVAQLELSTPNFALGEDVLLVDSPGLDATGYEAHEKLTLETLLPTVDIVVFVTTVKSEVDKKMKQTLDTIAKYDCPVMIVQNMLDAVRPSVDGKKSAATVAKERMNRVLLAVEQSAIKNKSEVKVSQISAVNAMRYRCNPNPTEQEERAYKAARYDDFVAGVKDLIKSKRPEIEKQRVRTILEHLEDLIRQEDKRTENVSTSLTADTALTAISDNITCALEDTYNDIYNVIMELEKIYAKYFSDDSEAAGRKISGLVSAFLRKDTLDEEDIAEIKNVVKKFESKTIESVQAFSEKCSMAIEKLNLPARDLWSYNGLPRMPEVSVKTKVVQRRRTVKKSGILRSILRGITFGLYKGEETEYYTETIRDDEATKESVKRYIKRLQREYAKTLDAWSTNAKSTVLSIQQEIDLRVSAIKEKEQQVLDANDWKQLRKELEKCFKRYAGKSQKQEKNVYERVNDDTNVSIGTKLIKAPYKFAQLYHAAEKYLHAVQGSVFNYAMEIKQRRDYPVIVISNSPDNLSDFLFRFYQIKKTDFRSEQSYCLSNELSVACSPTADQIKSMLEQRSGANVFLLINGLQFHTEFETILRRSVQENLRPNDALFLTIQDFEVLSNGNAISECLRSVHMEQNATANGEKGMTLVSHKNPVYNMAIIYAQTTDVKLKEETAFYDSLTARFPKLVSEIEKKRINNILRS